MIHLIVKRASKKEIKEMLQVFGSFIKLAVDVRRGILAGGGELHADCEQILLDNGSEQSDIWGADWDPINKVVSYESLINIRPKQNNRKLEIQNPDLRKKVERIVLDLLEEGHHE